ncbi:Protein of unknown function (DUF616) [Melia azedarach]|uniref:Uncharacterized protein n=1 Tax=Melia azedarach TaxID=155640 RepID=A0ACC1X0Y0_MELAZ|nr:Protein of unknown function (DUF616) [Melia azedarach]
MGKSKSYRTPPLFQSKLLCFSMLYLFTVLFIALYHALSETKCLFRSSPFDPIQAPLFSYPSTYGEHKYAIPTHRSSCSSPVFFSDYWPVLEEIQNLCRNSSAFTPVLRYMRRNAVTFGGNFSTRKRLSYFDHHNDNVNVPCGFLNKFPVSNSDRTAMENCNGVVVVSAIFDNHDKIRQPKGLGSKTLDTDYKIGAWRIVKVSMMNLYENPAMNVVIPKYLVHRLFPNSKFSIWINAQLQLTVDPLLLIHTLVLMENVDMAIPKHPLFIHTMEQAMETARWKKWWDVDSLQLQMETYCKNGLQPWSSNKLPYPSDVPNTAIILRKHGLNNNLFSCLMFNELEAFNPRDQLPFAFVRDFMNPKLKLNMFEEDVFEQIAAEYRRSLKKFPRSFIGESFTAERTKRASRDLIVNSSCCSSCQNYLSEIWDESHD